MVSELCLRDGAHEADALYARVLFATKLGFNVKYTTYVKMTIFASKRSHLCLN